MFPDPDLVKETLRKTILLRLSEAEEQTAISQVQREALQRLLDPVKLEALAKQTIDAIQAIKPKLIEDALIQLFEEEARSIRWTEALERLKKLGFAVPEDDLLMVLKSNPRFRQSGQGWWKMIADRGFVRDFDTMDLVGPVECLNTRGGVKVAT